MKPKTVAIGAVLLVAALVALAGPTSKAIAEPVVLKCRTQGGQEASDLTIDIENNKMKWGSNYNIVHVSSEYITAYQETNIVGGEVFVIHRATGDYWRALAGKYCSSRVCDDEKMGVLTYRGRCSRTMF